MLRWLLPATALALAGCGSQPATCEEDQDHHCFQGLILDSVGRSLEGAQVCNLDDEELPCAVSDRDGSFQLPGLPTEGRLTFLTELQGYQPVVNPLQAEMLPRTRIESYLVTDGLAELQQERFIVPVDEGFGFLVIDLGLQTREDPIGWGHVTDGTLTVESGGDTTVMYLNALYLPDEDLEGTSRTGFVAVANVPPGEVRVRANAPGGLCEDNLQGWDPVDGEGVAPVHADRTTYFAMGCPE